MTTTNRYAPGAGSVRCRHCGGPIACNHPRRVRCDTCRRPEPIRSAYHRRIALYAARLAAGEPIFQEQAA